MPYKNPEDRRAQLRRKYAENPRERCAYHKAWREKNKERLAEYRKQYREGTRGAQGRWLRYGLTPEQFKEMVATQGGACAICRKVPLEILRVDHDHVTGQVRALLCRKCNTGIGFLGDSVQSVTKALMYLRHHAARGRRESA